MMLSAIVLTGIATAAVSQEAKPAAAGADGRLDAEGFLKWPLFDARAAADTRKAIIELIPAEPPKAAKEPKRLPKKPAEREVQVRRGRPGA